MGMGRCDGGCEGLDCWEEEEEGFHIGLFNLRRRKTGSVSVLGGSSMMLWPMWLLASRFKRVISKVENRE